MDRASLIVKHVQCMNGAVTSEPVCTSLITPECGNCMQWQEFMYIRATLSHTHSRTYYVLEMTKWLMCRPNYSSESAPMPSSENPVTTRRQKLSSSRTAIREKAPTLNGAITYPILDRPETDRKHIILFARSIAPLWLFVLITSIYENREKENSDFKPGALGGL